VPAVQAVIVPVDLLKIRLQLQTALPGSPGYVGPLSLLGRVLRREGLRGEQGGALPPTWGQHAGSGRAWGWIGWWH
jgi:hypothetical protein